MHELASQLVQNDKRNLFFYLKKVWFSNEAHVGGLSVALTTQKTKKQDWIETKRHIEKEAKERNIFYNMWEPKKKEEGGGGTWCGVATTTTKTCWWWRQREQELVSTQ